MYTIGLVGYGRWGKVLSREIQSHHRLRLASICHPSAKEDKEFFFTSLDDLIESSNPDAVVIAAPLKYRGDLIRTALMANKSVLTEKPIAGSADEAKLLAKIAKARQLTLHTNYVHAYSQGVSHAIDHLHELGELESIDIVMNQPGPTYAAEGPISLLVSHGFAIAIRSIAGDNNLIDLDLRHCCEASNKRMAYVEGFFPAHGLKLKITANIAHPLRQRSIDYILSKGTMSIQLTGPASGVWTCFSRSPINSDNSIPDTAGIKLDETKNICNVISDFVVAMDRNATGNIMLAISVQNALQQCKVLQMQE